MFQKKFLSLLTAVSLTVASFSGGITAPVAAEASSTETIVLTKEDCMTYDVFMSSLKKEGLSGWHRSVYGEGECDAGGIGITYASKRKKVVDDAQEDKYHYEYNEVNDYFCFSPTYFSDHEIYYYKLDHFLTENDKLTIRFYINDDFYKLDLEGKTLSTWKELYEAEGYSTDEMPILSNPSYIFHVPMELETPQDRKGSSTEDHPATEAPGSRTITIKKEDCISEDAFRSYLEKEGLSSSSYWENSNAKVENVKRYERVYVASTGQYSYEEIYVDDYLCLSGGDGENYYYKLDEIKEGSQLIVNYSIGDDVYKITMEGKSADDLNRYYNGLDENSNGDYKYFSETSHVFHHIVSVESTGTATKAENEMKKAVKKLVVHKPVKIPNVTLPKLKKEKLSDDIIVGKKGKDLPDIGWVCNIIIKKGSLKEAAKLHKYLKKYKGKKYKGKYPSYEVHLKIKASNRSKAMKILDKLQKNLGYVNKYGIQVLAEDDSDHYYCMKKGKYFITNYDWYDAGKYCYYLKVFKKAWEKYKKAVKKSKYSLPKGVSLCDFADTIKVYVIQNFLMDHLKEVPVEQASKENYKKGIYAKMGATVGIDLLYSQKQTVTYQGVECLWDFDLMDLLNIKGKSSDWWRTIIYLYPKNSAGKKVTLSITEGVFAFDPSKSYSADYMDFKAFDTLTNQ